MIKVSEIQYAFQSGYKKEFFDENEKLIGETNIVISKGSSEKDGFEYLMLFNNDGTIIRDVHKYLNIELSSCSVNTRLQVCTALKYLYSFLEIYSYKINELGKDEIRQLKEFLLGGTRKGTYYNIENLARRSNETINTYLTHYRNYFNFLGVDNEILNKRINVTVESVDVGAMPTIRHNIFKKYEVNLKVGEKKQTVPRYIKEEEFNRILKYIKDSDIYGIREEIIVRLMFENGLRLGEALGLTLEDICEPKIYIRNRVSDKQYQRAKTAMKVKIKDEYLTTAYETYKVGYFIIKPKRTTLSKINKYLSENSFETMTDKCKQNYIKKSKADTVGNGYDLEQGNYYIFLNKDGSPLSYSGWNKILRNIFENIGLSLDKNKRTHNLNHRFRHGFAMKMVKNGATALDIKDALRNHTISSVDCYFRATEEDMYDANEYATDVMEEYSDVGESYMEVLTHEE